MIEKKKIKKKDNKTLSFEVNNLINKDNDLISKIDSKKVLQKDKTLEMELHHHMAPPGGIIDDLD